MRRILSIVTVLTMLMSVPLGVSQASAAPASPASPSLHRFQDVGDTVSIPDVDGNEIGTVTITDFDDNFTDFSERRQRDLQYVSVGLSIENTSKDPIPVEPGNMALIDDEGLIYSDIDLTRDDNADEIESGEVAPDDTLEGYIEIGFPKERDINQLIWVVGQGQLPTLLNMADPVEEGDTVTLFTQDYDEEATITADKVTIGFDDFSPDLTIQDGYQIIGAQVTIENTGTDDFTPDPSRFFIATTDGVFWVPDTSITRSNRAVKRVPDLTDDPVAPGDSTTGFLTFSVKDSETVDYVIYFPDGFRLVRLYDNPDARSSDNDNGKGTPDTGDENDNGKDTNGGLGPLGGKKTPTPADDNTNTNTGRKTPTPKSGNTDDQDCTGAADYQDETLANLNDWSGALGSIDFANVMNADPADLRDVASQLHDAADAQDNVDVPAAAAEFNDLLVKGFEDTASAVDDLADAVESGDTAAVGDAATAISEVGTDFQSGDTADALKTLEDTCPEIDQL